MQLIIATDLKLRINRRATEEWSKASLPSSLQVRRTRSEKIHSDELTAKSNRNYLSTTGQLLIVWWFQTSSNGKQA